MELKYLESNNISILQTNTKTRRLGYLKIIIELFETSNYYPTTYLNRHVENICFKYIDELKDYGTKKGDDKGLIKLTSNGSSAKPYIELLEQLNLLTQINHSYILTKQSKIYFHLNKTVTQNDNIFKLNTLDKLFFLRQILKVDSLYILGILNIIYTSQQPLSTIKIKEQFVAYIIKELDLNQQNTDNNVTKRKIMELKIRILSWKKPITYLEHIIEPRINWLVDLGILEIKLDTKEKKYCLSSFGFNFVNILSEISDKNLNKSLVIESILNNNYFLIFNSTFDLNKVKSNLNINKIDEYLLEAFQIFKTEAPNRIAASQAIDYVCFNSFLKDNLILEFEDIKKHLQGFNNNFSMDWFRTENDGALYLKK
ncbi:hypothetical protein NWE55_01775 [Myroides albus]|uniref:hypothetical protein n=1 Tax=Myroides albus TaxID=2562892 RepID=UPI0021591176|nr:hypothetical protein [Myroides albus]UVD80046.1 hypothetical protein NWE55_01775 [Myroides albus]